MAMALSREALVDSITYARGEDWPQTIDGRGTIARVLFDVLPDLERLTLTVLAWMVLEVSTPGFEVPEHARNAVDQVRHIGTLVRYSSSF